MFKKYLSSTWTVEWETIKKNFVKKVIIIIGKTQRTPKNECNSKLISHLRAHEFEELSQIYIFNLTPLKNVQSQCIQFILLQTKLLFSISPHPFIHPSIHLILPSIHSFIHLIRLSSHLSIRYLYLNLEPILRKECFMPTGLEGPLSLKNP